VKQHGRLGLSCRQCDCCCECEGELFDADELGLDPEDDEKRKYGDPGVGRELLNEIITLGRRLSALYEGKNA